MEWTVELATKSFTPCNRAGGAFARRAQVSNSPTVTEDKCNPPMCSITLVVTRRSFFKNAEQMSVSRRKLIRALAASPSDARGSNQDSGPNLQDRPTMFQQHAGAHRPLPDLSVMWKRARELRRLLLHYHPEGPFHRAIRSSARERFLVDQLPYQPCSSVSRPVPSPRPSTVAPRRSSSDSHRLLSGVSFS